MPLLKLENPTQEQAETLINHIRLEGKEAIKTSLDNFSYSSIKNTKSASKNVSS